MEGVTNMATTLRGTIKNPQGNPIKGAAVRLTGSKAALGHVAGAVVGGAPGKVSWTRPLTGLSSHRWNAWQQHVRDQVAGITWEEFKDQVLVHNPHLAVDGNIFQPQKQYRFPEQAPSALVEWTRELTGFTGHRWAAWTQFVQGKVAGITWEEFRDEALARNPELAADGNVFQAQKRYKLPQNVLDAEGIVWTRELTGFAGHRWACWEAHVKDEVQGISWGEFVDEVVEHNPQLAADGMLFRPEKRYMLPRNAREPLYSLFSATDPSGGYLFEGLWPRGAPPPAPAQPDDDARCSTEDERGACTARPRHEGIHPVEGGTVHARR
jgi:hypothetical protein